ncbi:unnamed protein product [Owenia fusiformis]|uniref:Uncharacterized protein n=1 Tax=Owenia fusiformis TaxID=6347 RepID=A0A8S4Q9A3_OWEFU|nr:unnamed protein product [Owenia fusiformis]
MRIEDCLCECISSPRWLIVRIILYFLSAILGITAAISMAIARGAFYQKILHPNGICVLYGSTTLKGIDYGEDEPIRVLTFNEGSNATCNFIIAINSITTIALPLILGIILLISIIRRKFIVDMMQNKMVDIGMLIFSCTVLIFAFISGVIASSGYSAWCSSLFESFKSAIKEIAEREGISEDDLTRGLNSLRCHQLPLKMKAQQTDSWKDADDINYTGPMDSLEGASWVLVVVWTVICIIELLTLFVNRRRVRRSTSKTTGTVPEEKY